VVNATRAGIVCALLSAMLAGCDEGQPSSSANRSGPGVDPTCKKALIGTWQSDAARTMAYNREHARLEARQDEFLSTLMGKMSLTFGESELRTRMPDTQVSVKGKLVPFAGFDETTPYEVLFCNSRMLVVKSRAPFTNEDEVTTVFLDGAASMWAYVGNNRDDVPDLHIREYFRRISEAPR
jgi:hypothetical protein